MRCRVCQHEIGPADSSCPQCGAAALTKMCGACKAENDLNNAFCGQCGQKFEARAPAGHVTAETISANAALAARQSFSSERKFLTIFCADIRASTDLVSALDPEDALARLSPALKAMAAAVRAFGGIVSEELGDGVLALFGAPNADDDHAANACRAALSLLERIKASGDPDLQVRVGIHSGYAITGYKQHDFTKVFGAGGPAVHLADRLQSAAAPNTILISSSCFELAGGQFEMRPVASLKLKGFATDIPALQLIGNAGASRWKIRQTQASEIFVNREKELRGLRDAASQARSGVGVCSALIGETGIGKSRLAHEIFDALRLEGWRVAETECDPTFRNVPFYAVRRLLFDAFSADEPELIDLFRKEGVLPKDSGGTWDAAFAAVLDHPFENELWTHLEPAMKRRLMMSSARLAVERALGATRSALLVEDMHLCDEDSSAVLKSVAASLETRPAFLILTSRGEGAPAWFTEHFVQAFYLLALTATPARRLLDSLLGPSEELEDIKRRLLDHTGGVPLFMEETVRSLSESGVLKGARGAYASAASADPLGIPPTVQGVVAARIDRLPPDCKYLLQVSSVIGRRISARVLQNVAQRSARDVRALLATIVKAGLATEARAGTEAEWEFAHDLAREVAYDSILREQRIAIHGDVLAALEVEGDAESDEGLERLCHHSFESSDWAKVERYAPLVARKSAARSIFSHAARYFDLTVNAIDRAPSDAAREERAIDIRIEARITFSAVGNSQRMLELTEEAETRASAIGDPAREAAASGAKSQALTVFGTAIEAVAAGESAVEKARASGDVRWLNMSEYGLGQAYFVAGRYRDSVNVLAGPAARLSDPASPKPFGSSIAHSRLVCLVVKAMSHAWMGEFGNAEKTLADARPSAPENYRPYEEVAAGYASGALAVFKGELASAIETLEAALASSRQNEIRAFLPSILNQLGLAFMLNGDLARAELHLEQANSIAKAMGLAIARLAATTNYSSLLTLQGEPARALGLAEKSVEEAEKKGYQGVRAQALCTLAQAMSALGTQGQNSAETMLRKAISIAARIEARPYLMLAYLQLADLLRAGGRREESRIEHCAAMQLAREMGLDCKGEPM